MPRCGGSPTNATVTAARCGASVMLAGRTGDDRRGNGLETRLLAETADLRWWRRSTRLHNRISAKELGCIREYYAGKNRNIASVIKVRLLPCARTAVIILTYSAIAVRCDRSAKRNLAVV